MRKLSLSSVGAGLAEALKKDECLFALLEPALCVGTLRQIRVSLGAASFLSLPCKSQALECLVKLVAWKPPPDENGKLVGQKAGSGREHRNVGGVCHCVTLWWLWVGG